jgi:hypothetical protein
MNWTGAINGLSLFGIVTLLVLFALNVIEPVKFGLMAVPLLVVFAVSFFGAETITELKVFGASIKRDVRAAREIRNEVRAMARTIARMMALNELRSLVGDRENEIDNATKRDISSQVTKDGSTVELSRTPCWKGGTEKQVLNGPNALGQPSGHGR